MRTPSSFQPGVVDYVHTPTTEATMAAIWKHCKNKLCGEPFPNVPGIEYCCGMCEDEDKS